MRFVLALGLAIGLLVTWQMRPAQSSAVTVGTNYQEASARLAPQVPGSAGCNNTGICYVSFNIVAAGKQLLITDVSCDVFINAGANAAILKAAVITFLGNNDATDRFTSVRTAVTYEQTPSLREFIVKDTTRHLVRAGERPVMQLRPVLPVASLSGGCSIAGKIGNPPE